MASTGSAPKNTKSFTLTLDYRFITGVLIVVIIAMLLLWRPWEFRPGANARTVTASGQATVTAVPDEFLFMPSYEVKGANKDAALKELTAKGDEIVKKLKALGVADSKIKTDTSGYDTPIYGYEGSPTEIAPIPRDTQPAYTLTMTITVGNKELAQKVQDYLVSTTPMGAVSPQATFSDVKRKELENKAREEATKEARAKAEQSAKNLGFAIGQVKSVDDGNGFDGSIIEPAAGDSAVTSKLSLQPGENKLVYQVTVVYYIK